MNLKPTLLFLGVVTLVSSVNAQEWTRFRGPEGSGISGAKTIPTKWSEGDINWKIKLPGTGHSSPVAWGDRLFITTTSDKEGGLSVLCLSAKTGKQLWKKEFKLNAFRKHKYNSFASTTPALDAERLYVGWSMPEKYTFAALTHDGDLVWERDLGPFVTQHGSGGSPTIYKDKIILSQEKDADSFLIALDPRSGKTIWRTPRDSKVATYGTASIYRPKGGKEQLLFTSQAHGIYSIDPDTGSVVWDMPGLFTKRSLCSVTVAGDVAWGSCGSGGGGNYVVAVRPGIPEKNRKPEIAWKINRSSLSPYVPTSLVKGEYAWLASDAGYLTCIKHQTGEMVYSERLAEGGGRGAGIFSSPIMVDGRIFCVSTQGKVYVVDGGLKFKVLSTYDLGDITHATPAVHHGRMYVRTEKYLFSVGGK